MRHNFVFQFNKLLVILLFSVSMLLSWDAIAEEEAASDYVIGGTGPAGGIVFYLTYDGKHGLEAAQNDQARNTPWYNEYFVFIIDKEEKSRWIDPIIIGKTESKLGAGQNNTTTIVSVHMEDNPTNSNFAAKLAADYHVQKNGKPCTESPEEACFRDWYLPSIEELDLMYKNLAKKSLGNFTYNYYWSSTEAVLGNPDGRPQLYRSKAWAQRMDESGEKSLEIKTRKFSVRAIRSF